VCGVKTPPETLTARKISPAFFLMIEKKAGFSNKIGKKRPRSFFAGKGERGPNSTPTFFIKRGETSVRKGEEKKV